MITTIVIAALGAAFFVMYVGLATISFDATYIMPAIVKLEDLAKGSNLTIDYNSYKIKNYNRGISIGIILVTIMPLAGMIYVAYYFEAFEMVMSTICIVIMVSSILLMISSNTKQRRFVKLLMDIRSFTNVEGIDNTFYKSIKRFQTFQMLLLVVIMVTTMLAL